MNEPVYETIYSTNEDRYTFESVGKKGIILKVVKFVEIYNNIYNFGFGDFDPITNKIDDKVVSDNGDLGFPCKKIRYNKNKLYRFFCLVFFLTFF